MSNRNSAVKTRLHTLLFVEPFGPRGKPLFASQTDLARWITEAGYYKNSQTSMACLSQAFTTRPVTEKLLEGVCQAAISRAEISAPDISAQELRQRIVQLVNADEMERRRGPRQPPRATVNGLIASQRLARSVFILNRRPIELTGLAEGNPAAAELTRDALQAMSEGRKYAWCLDSRSVGIQQLGALRAGIIRFGLGDPDALLERWTCDGTLSMHVVAPELCVHPTAVFDPLCAERMSAWVWYVPFGWDSCVRMPREFHPTFLERVYDPIVHAGNASRISWEEARATLV